MLLPALLVAADLTGSLLGKVTLSGPAPKLATLPVTRDAKVCGTGKPDQSLQVGPRGGVKDAVVWLTDVPEAGDARKEKVKLDQKDCEFAPHVVAAPLGSTLEVENSDAVLHNARAQEGSTRLFNYAMPIKDYVVPTRLKKEGTFRLSCDVHPWMRGWLLVLPTQAFAVSAEDGSFRLTGVPAGKHRLKVWHERLGEREAEVEVPPGGTATYDVSFPPR